MKKTNEQKGLIRVKAFHTGTLFPRPANKLGTEDNTFGICKFDVESVVEGNPTLTGFNEITIVGEFHETPRAGVLYTIVAKEKVHPKFGVQYELKYIADLPDFNKTYVQKEFLRLFVTENQMEALFKAFSNPMEIISKHDVNSLVTVKGIKEATALKIIEKYESKKDNSEAYMALADYGLTTKFIDKIVSVYRSPSAAVKIVEENPYQLCYDVEGVGFKRADTIALGMGMSEKSLERIKGYIFYFLTEQGNNGFSWLYASELLNEIYNFFGGKNSILEAIVQDGVVVGNNISSAIKELCDKKVLVLEDSFENESRGNRKVYLKYYYDLESKIATHLNRIRTACPSFNLTDIEEKISAFEDENGIQYTEEQKDGIKKALSNQITLITGLAGSGKSTLVAGLISCLKKEVRIAQCCLAGKAASNLQEITGIDSSTIHKLLRYNPVTGFVYNDSCPLNVDIVILDEVSLIGGELFLSLIKAIPSGAKLVILGDRGQLESLGSLNIANDLYESPVITTVELTKIHRQAAKSGIITYAREVRAQMNKYNKADFGETVIGELQDMHLVLSEAKEKIKETAFEEFKKYYPMVNKDIMKIQLISPIKERGTSCVYELNNIIQDYVNPALGKEELDIFLNPNKPYSLREDDKVMCIENTYQMVSWSGNTVDVFNGWTGIIKTISSKEVAVFFPIIDDTVSFTIEDAKLKLILGYASTVHKCVTGDTIVYTDKGIKRIKELKNKWENIKIFNGKYLESPSAFVENPISACKKITTKRNFTIVGTLEHGITVLNSEKKFERKDFKDVKLGDMVVFKRNSNVFGNVKELPKEYFDMPICDKRTIVYNLPQEMDVDFAKFLGYMVADGTVCESGIKLGKKEEDYVSDFCDLVKKIFGYETHYKYLNKANMYLTEINSRYIRDFCRNIDGLLPNKKRIPYIILESNKECQKAFLSVLFEDGNINFKKGRFDHIELVLKDLSIIEEVRIMLLNFGIVSSYANKKFCAKKRNTPYEYNTLYIYRKDAIIFNEEIGFSSKLNKNKIQSAYKEINESFSNPDFSSQKLCCDNSFFVEPVINIEDCFEKTYCVEMPETHKFIQNGFYGYNCQGSSIPVVIGVIDYSTPPQMLTTELIYTLITRAKTACVLVAQKGALDFAIRQSHVSNKRTFLQGFLQNGAKDA